LGAIKTLLGGCRCSKTSQNRKNWLHHLIALQKPAEIYLNGVLINEGECP